MYFRFVNDVMSCHVIVSTVIQAWRIIHRDFPDGTGDDVCCRRLPLQQGVIQKVVVGLLNRVLRHVDVCVYSKQWRSVPVSQHRQLYLNSIRLQRC